jgi:hypothetical protein
MPIVLGDLLDAPSLEVFTQDQSTYCAFQTPRGWALPAWGVLGLLAWVFAQGLIAALALQEAERLAGDHSLVASLREAYRSVAARAPALLSGWLAYALPLTVAVAGLSAPLLGRHPGPAQLPAGDDLEYALGHPATLLASLLGDEAGQRVVTALTPNPGVLPCSVAGMMQAAVFKPMADPAGPVWQPASTFRPPVYLAHTGWAWPAALGGLVLLLITGTLLRFRSAAALADQPRAGWAGVGMAWRYFGTVALHAGLLRIAVAGVQVPLIAVPALLAERLVIPWAGRVAWAPWAVPACVLGVAASVALVNGVLSAFTVVYDARLFVALLKIDPGAARSRTRQA